MYIMKKYFLSFNFLFLLFIVASCSKDASEKEVSDKKYKDSKESKTVENKTTSTDNSVKTVSNTDLFIVESVEKSAGKKVSPNVTWTEDGKKASLNDLKGNVILLNFWATWCGPCIKEMPDLSSISEELKSKNFRMIGMNVFQQEKSAKVSDFLKTNPVKYTILDGNQEVVDAFGEATGENIEAVPTTFIIDKNGKIAETIIGSRKKDDFLKIINKYLN